MVRSLLQLLLLCGLMLCTDAFRRSARPAAGRTALFGGGVLRGDRLPQLLEMIGAQDRGLLTDRRDEIKRLIDAIAQQNAEFVGRDKQMFSRVGGRWRLLYTTEKETLFFAKSGLFGSKCLGIYQVIDTKARSINNLIEFEDGKSFSVLGAIDDNSDVAARVDFKFTRAAIKLPFEIAVSDTNKQVI